MSKKKVLVFYIKKCMGVGVKSEVAGQRVAVGGWQWYESIREIMAVILVVKWLGFEQY
jgi:hypothetical protein